jgi:hypothetical protein
MPRSIPYVPPKFSACVAHLGGEGHAQLRRRCQHTYEGIQRRILGFLITGYWLREEAVAQHISVSRGEVHSKFAQERRVNYPTETSFRRLQSASRQTIPDLEFAAETQMLSAKLLERFTTAHPHLHGERATVAAFNRSIRQAWEPKTVCSANYVVPDCREY